MSPSTAPSSNCEDQSREDALFDELEAITPGSILLDPSSPQGQAYVWLRDTDPAQIDPCTYETLDQRYSLTTLYYSTDGNNWVNNTGWLTGQPECDWGELICSSDNMLTELELGKCF